MEGGNEPISLEEMKRLARERGEKLYSIYYKLPHSWRREADRILDKLTYGESTYEEALKEMKKLYARYRKIQRMRIKKHR